MSIWPYVLRRILETVPLIFAVIIANFVIIHLTPGDPAIALVGGLGATPEYLTAIRAELGLNKPLYEQLLIYISHVIRGDLGYSFVYRQPVLDVILSRVPLTVLLVGTALIFAAATGIAVGVFSAKRPYSILDSTAMALSMIGYSIPVFWLGQML